MLEQLLSMFLSFIMSFLTLFGIGVPTDPQPDPEPVTPVYVSEQTLQYGADSDQTLDLLFPAGKTGNAKLILFLHGGAWVTGTKETYLPEAIRWQQQGYVTATMNYRFISNGVLPANELDDITSALTAIKSVAADRGISLSRTALVGNSSGGHLALLYAYTRTTEAPITPAVVISSSAPTDLTDPAFLQGSAAGEMVAGMLGVTPDTIALLAQTGIGQLFMTPLANLSPAKKVTSSCVPTLFAHGMQDNIVPYSNALKLKDALDQAGVAYDFISFPNSGHALLNDPDCTLRFNTLTSQYLARYLGS